MAGIPWISKVMRSISANSLAKDSTDFILNFSYGRADRTMTDANGTSTMSDGTTFNLGLDYVYHYDENVFQNGMFRPYAGLGVSYLGDDLGIALGDDGFTWSFLGEPKFFFTDNSLSCSVEGSLVCGRTSVKTISTCTRA